MSTRLTLRRSDGRTFLERWGWECEWFGVFVHKIGAPDPGSDVHGHPWNFWSLVLRGGYEEYRAHKAVADVLARADSRLHFRRGTPCVHKWLSFKKLGLDETHTIHKVKPNTWTLVLRGRKRQKWGFYTPDGYMLAEEYENSYWGAIRDLSEVSC